MSVTAKVCEKLAAMGLFDPSSRLYLPFLTPHEWNLTETTDISGVASTYLKEASIPFRPKSRF
jgi:hypothetical protein